MNARYFERYCGRAPYDEIWLDHSGAGNCVATLRRMRVPVTSLAVLETASRVGAYFHFYSSTSEDHEPGDDQRVTLRPRAWWRARFLASGWAPTRSRYLWRSTRGPSVPG